MKVFNIMAAAHLEASENVAQVYPNADQVVASTSTETMTDGKITLEREWGYNAGGDPIVVSAWSIVDLPTLVGIADIGDAYEITGTNFIANSQVFLEFCPDLNTMHGDSKFRYLLTTTFNNAVSIDFLWNDAVIKAVKEGGTIPRLLAGPAKLIYQDLTKELEIDLSLTVSVTRALSS